jgi:hypothetical protein
MCPVLPSKKFAVLCMPHARKKNAFSKLIGVRVPRWIKAGQSV